MRILLATTNSQVTGGTETYLRALIPMLRQRGFEIGLLTSAAPNSGQLPLAPVPLPSWTLSHRHLGEMLKEVSQWQPSVVYAHGLNDPTLEAAVAEQFPTVYYAHNYGGTCASGNKSFAFPSVQPCERPLGLGCLALYLPRRCGGKNPVTAVRMYLRERRRQETFCGYRAILAASTHMVAELSRNGAPPHRVYLVPHPVTIDRDPNAPTPRPYSGRVLFVGRITNLKGWSHLIDAVPRAAAALGRPLTLVVAGEGPDRQQFELLARRAGIAAEFLGWVGAAQRESEMRAADVLLVPSVWPEPFGLVGVEAGCVGLPAVGYAVGGIPDWLIPGVSGESAPGERPDPKDLAAALVRALSNERHWQSLRVGAWETAERFSPEAHLERLIPILEAAAR